MQNFIRIKNPHEHFATFWKEHSTNPEERLSELQDDLSRAVELVNSESALSRCATVEVPFQDSEASGQSILWVVSGDVVEVALIACEMVKQQQELAKDKEQQTRKRLEQSLDLDE